MTRSLNCRTWMELLFLSFSTLSGVGLSDIIPIRPQARALVMLEQFAGVMYIALVVSRLIALTTLRVRAQRDDDDARAAGCLAGLDRWDLRPLYSDYY